MESFENTICGICKKDFSVRSNLRAHVKRFHPDELEELAPKKTFNCAALCTTCGKSFAKNSNLTQHINRFHKGVEEERNPTGLKCILCEDNSATKKECFKKPDLFEHFKVEHSIDVVTETFHFGSLEAFENWKKQEEAKTKESFINKKGTFIAQNYKRTKYVCHRSGTFKSQGTGSRHLKTQGSKKIGGFCPAEIIVKEADGQLEVEYVRTHVGHTNDLGHLNLTKTEREALAAQIASKIPFETILDQVRESISNDDVHRSQLLTKKDLFNIERSFNINSDIFRHQNDAVSVDAWVKQMEVSGCVLFYKPQGEPCEHAELKTEDFALIIMNRGQQEMLERYGDDCVCVDETHGINAYQFNLTSVLVLDDMREGFPACFLISNRSDEDMMYIFFMCIRNKLNKQLQPKVFMSDMAPAFYNAWVRVMKLPLYRLYCTWHVDRAWRRNLNKIKSKEGQVAVYKQLRTLLHETDSNAFAAMMEVFITTLLTDAVTTEFGRYFLDHYSKNVNAWAYCHRTYSGINTNMHIENMHRSIKYIYLKGKVNKRLDKAIHVLMKFVRDKLFSRLIVLNKGKISAKLRDLRVRHETSNALSISSIVRHDTGWIVPSSSSQELYTIEEVQSNDCDCKLICIYCETCIHKFSCSCLDSSIKWNMCKHIHLVCKFEKSQRLANAFAENSQLLQNTDAITTPGLAVLEKDKQEESHIIQALCLDKKKEVNEAEFLVRKENFKLRMLQIIEGITNIDELRAAERLLDPLQPTIAAVRLGKRKLNHDTDNTPHNKNIEQQKRFCPAKKKSAVSSD